MVIFCGDVPPLVSHSAHPEHALQLVATGNGGMFQCDGCMQIGHEQIIGDERRYRCEQCDFDLHICCALPAACFEHPMFKGTVLTFFRNRDLSPGARPGGIAWCDVCGNQVLGFLYHNLKYNLDMHPPCALLPECIVDDDGRVLDLDMAAGHICGYCGKNGHRGRYMSYRLLDDNGELVYFHVACMLEATYGSNGQVVQANPATPAAGEMQNAAPMRRTASSRFRRFCEVSDQVATVTEAVANLGMFATMDPDDGFFG